MSRLSPDLVLKRLPEIEVRINSDNHIQVVADDTVYYIDLWARMITNEPRSTVVRPRR